MLIDSRSMSIAATAPVVDDFPWATNTTGRVSATGAPTSGKVQFAGDQDLFAIDLMAGVSYDITLNRGSKSGVDPMLSLHGPSGKMVAHDTGGKSNQSAHLQFTPTATGTYYLGAQDQSGTGTGSYSLQARAIDDVASNVAKYVTVGAAPTSGRIEVASDTDRFAVELKAGSTYAFTLEGDSTAAGLDPRLQLSSKSGGKNGGGSKIATDDDSGNPLTGAARIEYTPSSSGTYYLDALGEAGTAGGYLLKATLLTSASAAAVAGHEALGIVDLQDIALVGLATSDGL